MKKIEESQRFGLHDLKRQGITNTKDTQYEKQEPVATARRQRTDGKAVPESEIEWTPALGYRNLPEAKKDVSG